MITFLVIAGFVCFFFMWHFVFGLAWLQSLIAGWLTTLLFGKLEQILMSLKEIKNRQV
jgi:hypothetical protein